MEPIQKPEREREDGRALVRRAFTLARAKRPKRRPPKARR